MKRSEDRILTTHVGSLVRTPEVIDVMRRMQLHQDYDTATFDKNLKQGVSEVVKDQAKYGVDIVSDGEFGKRGWLNYVEERLAGLEYVPAPGGQQPTAGGAIYTDQQRFAGFYPIYRSFESTMWLPPTEDGPAPRLPATILKNTSKISYKGQADLQRDIDNFKAALAGVQVEEAFLPVVAPASVNAYELNRDIYKTDEEFVYAVSDALRVEYRTIIAAGFLLQVDDAILPMHYNPNKGLDEYMPWAQMRIEALNYALEGIPEDRVRYHICWGSQNVPHTWDIPLKYIIDLLLTIKAQGLSIEAANPRHEHEWQVWEDTKLPDGKVLLPGMVSHSTNVVEHPELISWRLQNFARLVGRENVIASTDCGFSQFWNLVRTHPEVQWAKLEAITEGARLASEKLWA